MIEKLYNDIQVQVKEGQIIENLKGGASSKVIGKDSEKITFQVLSNGTITSITKKTFEHILNILLSDGKIRQRQAGKDPRISLGVLKTLPYFDVEKLDTTYLVWSYGGKDAFLNNNKS